MIGILGKPQGTKRSDVSKLHWNTTEFIIINIINTAADI